MQMDDAAAQTGEGKGWDKAVAPQQHVPPGACPEAQAQRVLPARSARDPDNVKAPLARGQDYPVRLGRSYDNDTDGELAKCLGNVQEHDFAPADVSVVAQKRDRLHQEVLSYTDTVRSAMSSLVSHADGGRNPAAA
ncbi:hypothetical protein GCM10009849_11860 [Sinomonas flava]|uniref:Uncharacterized protein n=1 Tax=Sinomonas flava TaxID=496857 RepID=A0ABP5NJI6_9MICC